VLERITEKIYLVSNWLYRKARISDNQVKYPGFTMIELMIVVVIVGILAAVSVPLYMTYIQKSRVRALVYPGLHIIETNIGLYYAMNNKLPPASDLPTMQREADTTYFHAEIIGNTLKIVVDSPNSRPKLSRLHNMPMYLTPTTSGNKITSWDLSGTLAYHLGILTK
jgi:prepilin-type N-terminal cleavage/methylation domain-containing protein